MTSDATTTIAVRFFWTDREQRRELSLAALAVLVFGAAFAAFGLPPIGMHAPPHYIGIMAPSCGLTRGTAALLAGSLRRGLRYNPASPLVVVGAVALLLRLLVGLSTGRWLEWRVRLTRVGWVVLGMATTALAINQQLHARLLMG